MTPRGCDSYFESSLWHGLASGNSKYFGSSNYRSRMDIQVVIFRRDLLLGRGSTPAGATCASRLHTFNRRQRWGPQLRTESDQTLPFLVLDADIPLPAAVVAPSAEVPCNGIAVSSAGLVIGSASCSFSVSPVCPVR